MTTRRREVHRPYCKQSLVLTAPAGNSSAAAMELELRRQCNGRPAATKHRDGSYSEAGRVCSSRPRAWSYRRSVVDRFPIARLMLQPVRTRNQLLITVMM